MNTLRQTMTNERQAMNYNINVIKFVWRQFSQTKPSHARCDYLAKSTKDAAMIVARANLVNVHSKPALAGRATLSLAVL
jgi:hypothetical protein